MPVRGIMEKLLLRLLLFDVLHDVAQQRPAAKNELAIDVVEEVTVLHAEKLRGVSGLAGESR